MSERIEIRELERFVSIVEAGNLRQAAASLHTGQPVLSRLIRKLESGLGKVLLNRHSKGISPTEAGVTFFSEAQTILERLHKLSLGLGNAPESHDDSVITIGIPTSIPPMLAPYLAQILQSRQPNTQIRFKEGYDGEVEHWLINGTADVALTYSPQAGDAFDVTVVNTDTLALVMRPNAPEADSRDAIELRHVAGLPLILPGAAHPIRRRLTKGAVRYGLEIIPAVEVQGLRIALSMVRQNVGYTIVPLASVTDELNRGEVAAREIKRPTLEVKLYVVSRKTDDGRPLGLDLKTWSQLCTMVNDVSALSNRHAA